MTHAWLHPDLHVDDVRPGLPATVWCSLDNSPVPATLVAVACDDDGEPCEMLLMLEVGLPPFDGDTAEAGQTVHMQCIRGFWVTRNRIFRGGPMDEPQFLIGRRVLPKEIAA